MQRDASVVKLNEDVQPEVGFAPLRREFVAHGVAFL
jgi:hypothetical protein